LKLYIDFLSNHWSPLMGQPENVVELAKPYLILLFFTPLTVFKATNIDGMSETKYSMWATILGNVVNVILNYLFIYGSGFSRVRYCRCCHRNYCFVLLY
jgi:MATE family multidrug resistance protein